MYIKFDTAILPEFNIKNSQVIKYAIEKYNFATQIGDWEKSPHSVFDPPNISFKYTLMHKRTFLNNQEESTYIAENINLLSRFLCKEKTVEEFKNVLEILKEIKEGV